MQSNPKVSVIVPVYNVEKTLDRCMQSILDQTYRDYEVIMVDDGSTDNSGAVCDSYAARYPNVRVIHKPNEGLGPTRDRGLDEARGEYIYHCDSDDWLRPTLLERTVTAMDATGADVLVFGYTIYTEDADGRPKHYDEVNVPDCTLTSAQQVREFFCEQYYNSYVVQSACNRLYRRSFLMDNGLRFPALRRCQDMAYSLLLFSKINKLVCLHESFYNYIIEPGVFKGRSFDEMTGIYMDIYRRTRECFRSWDLYGAAQQRRLENKVCEHIANYVAYAVEHKYPDRRMANLRSLLSDGDIVAVFRHYDNPSRFVRAFAWCVTHGRARLLRLLIKAFYYRQTHA